MNGSELSSQEQQEFVVIIIDSMSISDSIRLPPEFITAVAVVQIRRNVCNFNLLFRTDHS